MTLSTRIAPFVRRSVRLSDKAPIGPIGVLFGLNFVDEFDRIAFATLTPEIRDAFGLTDTGIASVTIVTGLFLLFSSVPIGALADRVNRVRLATAAALLWGTMSILTGIVPTLLLLMLVRFFSGLGRGINEIVHPSLLTDLYRPDDLPAVFSLHRLANPISALSALVAGVIGATLGWQWAFVLLALPTVPLLLALRRLPEPERGRYRPGAPVAAAAAKGVAPAPPVELVEPVELLEPAEPAGAGEQDPAALSVRASVRILIKVRTLRRLWGAAVILGMAAVPAAVFMSLFFEKEYGFGSFGRGVAQVVLGGGSAAGLLLAGRLAPRVGDDSLVPALAVHTARWMAVAGIGILCTALAPSAILAVASLALVGLGTGGNQPVLLALVGRVTPPSSRALAFGMTGLFFGCGAILSLLLFGVGESSGYRVALVAAGLLAIGAAALLQSARRCVGQDLANLADAQEALVV